jgi:hypothetical protein
MEFENEDEYLKYINKIENAFRDQDIEKLSKLLGRRITKLSEAEWYFNDIWKKQVKIKLPKTKQKIK